MEANANDRERERKRERTRRRNHLLPPYGARGQVDSTERLERSSVLLLWFLFFFPSSSFSLLGEQHDESRLSGRRVQQPIVCCSSLRDVVKLVLWRRCTAIYDPFSLILFHFWLRSISTRARRQLFIYVALLMDDMEVQSATRSQAATTLDLMFR